MPIHDSVHDLNFLLKFTPMQIPRMNTGNILAYFLLCCTLVRSILAQRKMVSVIFIDSDIVATTIKIWHVAGGPDINTIRYLLISSSSSKCFFKTNQQEEVDKKIIHYSKGPTVAVFNKYFSICPHPIRLFLIFIWTFI